MQTGPHVLPTLNAGLYELENGGTDQVGHLRMGVVPSAFDHHDLGVESLTLDLGLLGGNTVESAICRSTYAFNNA